MLLQALHPQPERKKKMQKHEANHKKLIDQLRAVIFLAFFDPSFEDDPPNDYIYDKLIEFLQGLKKYK